MTCLALEFSSDRRSVAVARAGQVRAEVVHEGTRRTPVFGLIESALEQAGVGRREVECLAVGLGPGSYTGIRVAISVAQGWQLGRGIRTIGVNSLDALAVVAESAFPGPILLAVDAQRGEFAAAPAESGRLVGPVTLLAVDELRRRQESGWRVAGPEIASVFPEAKQLFPTASVVAQLAMGREAVPAELLMPVYLREASFVKAPPARVISEK